MAMIIKEIRTKDGSIYTVGSQLKANIGPENKIKEITYFEASSVYGKFLHAPLYAVKTAGTIRTVVPQTEVKEIVVDEPVADLGDIMKKEKGNVVNEA